MFKKIDSKIKYRTNGRPIILGKDSILLDGQSIDYTLKRSSRAKLIWLCYKPEEGLQVTVPPRYDLKYLPDFLKQHSVWILRHEAENKLKSIHPSKSPCPGDSILILGRPVAILRRNGAERNNVSFDGARLLVDIKADSDQGERQVLNWLAAKALKIITLKVEYWSALIKVTYNRISIRNQHSRWGSCSQLRNLSFNWRLIMAPEEILDYVIIHELCHLKEMNHQKAFWDKVAAFCPRWREYRQWLNRHRLELHSQLEF